MSCRCGVPMSDGRKTSGDVSRSRPSKRRASDRLQRFEGRLRTKIAAREPRPAPWLKPLTEEQRRALDNLERATRALNAAVAEPQRVPDDLTPCELKQDEALIGLITKRDRAVRRVIRAGVAEHPRAAVIVSDWLSHPGRSVPRGWREKLGISKVHGVRKFPTLEDGLLAVEVQRILDEQRSNEGCSLDPADAAPIRRALVARLRALRQGGTSAEMLGGKVAVKRLADQIAALTPKGWRERLVSLLDQD